MRIDAILPVIRKRLAVLRRDASFREAVAALAAGVDLVVISGDDCRPAGVLTRSDVLKWMTAGSVEDQPIEPAMTAEIVACVTADDLSATWRLMRHRHLSHVPVLDEAGQAVGVLNRDDALEALLAIEQGQELELVRYISGVGYR